jgi:hypothetical protein
MTDAVPNDIFIQHHPPSGSNGAWFCLRSPAVIRMAAIEILGNGHSLKIPNETKDALKLISIEHPNAHATPLKIWVDASGLDWVIRHQDEKDHRQTSIRYCIERQAHYPLMRRLFNINRSEMAELRKEILAELPPTKPKSIGTQDIDAIYEYWSELQQTYEREIDQWVLLGIRFQKYPLWSMSTILAARRQLSWPVEAGNDLNWLLC